MGGPAVGRAGSVRQADRQAGRREGGRAGSQVGRQVVCEAGSWGALARPALVYGHTTLNAPDLV